MTEPGKEEWEDAIHIEEPQPEDSEVDPKHEESGSPNGSWKTERPAEQNEIDDATEDA